MLDISSGEHSFNAFLHQRPAEQGTWKLVGDTLTIKASDTTFKYRIEKYSKGKLILVTDRGDREYYFRTKCVAFGT